LYVFPALPVFSKAFQYHKVEPAEPKVELANEYLGFQYHKVELAKPKVEPANEYLAFQ
jgi:hypothetical protein